MDLLRGFAERCLKKKKLRGRRVGKARIGGVARLGLKMCSD